MTVKKIYKLTDEKLQTKNSFQWKPGEWKTAPGYGPLCTKGWLHAYESPLVAAFMNPVHADIKNPVLWEAEGTGASLSDNGLKIGFNRMRIIKRIDLPEITVEQRVAVAIRCACTVYRSPRFLKWAENWINGIDRTKYPAAAQAAAEAEARAAVAWTARAAAWAARAAAAEAAGFNLHPIIEEVLNA